MQRILTSEISKHVNKRVRLAGWVHSRRDHGQVLFLDLRDREGLVQLVVSPQTTDYKLAQQLGPEDVIDVEGKVKKRPTGMVNPKIASGKLEIELSTLQRLSASRPLPFDVTANTLGISEQTRLTYRYLDLRSSRLRENIRLRDRLIKFIRQYFDKKSFWEIETPILTKSTPEGARDYLVPYRQKPGCYYALPQAPQQFKQLLMVAGIERYFQIARCFRDEDTRADRQPEFTQLDVEMSFCTQDDILELIEEMIVSCIKTLFPNKKISKVPFPRLDYSEALKKYKTDKPDLRYNSKDNNELAWCWIVNWPLFEVKTGEKYLDPMHHIFTAPKISDASEIEKHPLKMRSWQHDLVLNGVEVGGGSLRIIDPQIQRLIFKLVGIKKDEAEEKFGHILRAFEYGVPPHGGIAIGLDRVLCELLGEKSIREVIAFPKTGDGLDLLMGAPSLLSPPELKELSKKTKK